MLACKQRGNLGLIHLPVEILQLIASYLAPQFPLQSDYYYKETDALRKVAHNNVIEFLCTHSSINAIKPTFLWNYRVTALNYDEDRDEGESYICEHQKRLKFISSPPPVKKSYRVTSFYCRNGRRCRKGFTDSLVERQGGAFLKPLLSQFTHLSKLVIHPPLNTNVVGMVLEGCHATLTLLDCEIGSQSLTIYPLPILHQLKDLRIQFNNPTAWSDLENSNDAWMFLGVPPVARTYYSPVKTCCEFVGHIIDSLTPKIRKVKIVHGRMDNDVVHRLSTLNGLKELHILESESDCVRTYDLSAQVDPREQEFSVTLPRRHWDAFQQGNQRNLLQLKICNNGNKPRLPSFPCIPLRSLSLDFAVSSSALESIGTLPWLTYLEIFLDCGAKCLPSGSVRHDATPNPHAFPQLKKLKVDEIYLNYMLQCHLPNLSHLFLCGLPRTGEDLKNKVSKVPELPWSQQLVELVIIQYGATVWDSSACFSRLETLQFKFSEFLTPVQCEFPILKRLKFGCNLDLEHFEITPSRFPHLRTIEADRYLESPMEFALRRFSASIISLDVLNDLMKHDHVEDVKFSVLWSSESDPLQLVWHGTVSSIQLWKLLSSVEFDNSSTESIHLTFLSSEIDLKVIVPVLKLFAESGPSFPFELPGYCPPKKRGFFLPIFVKLEIANMQTSPDFKDLVKTMKDMKMIPTIALI
jgi:hypothetical protein